MFVRIFRVEYLTTLFPTTAAWNKYHQFTWSNWSKEEPHDYKGSCFFLSKIIACKKFYLCIFSSATYIDLVDKLDKMVIRADGLWRGGNIPSCQIYLLTKKQYIKKNIQANKNIKCFQTFKLLKYVYSLHCCISILKSIIFFYFLLCESYNK